MESPARQIGRCRVWSACRVGGLLACFAFSFGCRQAPVNMTGMPQLPSDHSVAAEGFVIRSQSEMAPNGPVVEGLRGLRETLRSELRLPPQRDPVSLYLFGDEAAYRGYMKHIWSNLPERRAYFVGSKRELAVYSFRGPHTDEDLRHEFTHGMLHASLGNVPLWLDEGLAEYFEQPTQMRPAAHPVHGAVWERLIRQGWKPNLYRLEHLVDFRDLGATEYAEAWGWVHFLLHHSEATRGVLLGYLEEMAESRSPGLLQPRLEAVLPGYQTQVVSHLLAVSNQPAQTGSIR